MLAHPHADIRLARLLCLGYTVMLLIIGFGINSDKTVETLIPDAWVWLLQVCAVSVALLGMFWQRWMLYLSGVLVPAMFLMRVWASFDRYIEDKTSIGRAFISVGLYGMLMMSTMVIWTRIFPRVVEYRELHREE